MVVLNLSMDNYKNFNHIKIHTQYSICEGALRINDLAEFCKKNKNRLIIFATHNREFAEMSDCKIEMIDGSIKSINGKL